MSSSRTNESIVTELVERHRLSKEVLAQKQPNGGSLLHMVLEHKSLSEQNKLTCVTRLLSLGVDANGKNNAQLTPLMLAVDKNSAKLVAILAHHPYTHLHETNQNGDTALSLAVKHQQSDIVVALLDACVKRGRYRSITNRNKDGDTPEIIARKLGNSELITMLAANKQHALHQKSLSAANMNRATGATDSARTPDAKSSEAVDRAGAAPSLGRAFSKKQQPAVGGWVGYRKSLRKGHSLQQAIKQPPRTPNMAEIRQYHSAHEATILEQANALNKNRPKLLGFLGAFRTSNRGPPAQPLAKNA